MAKTNFASILDAAPTEVDYPKALPAGTYLTVVKGMPEHGESSKKKTKQVTFTLGMLQADDDVDEAELKEVLGDTPLTDKTMKHIVYLTENSVYRLDEFFEHCGIELDGKKSRTQMLEETPGCQVLVSVGHEASEDGKTFFARIKGTAKPE